MKTIEPCEPGSKEETKCFEEMELEGSIRYEVTTKTSEDSRSGTSSPIHIRFLGKKGRSDDKMLSEQGLKTGSLVTSNIFINDIGDIKGIEIIHINSDLSKFFTKMVILISNKMKLYILYL